MKSREVPPPNESRLFSLSNVNRRLFELFPSKVTSATVTSVALVIPIATKLPSKGKAVPPLTP